MLYWVSKKKLEFFFDLLPKTHRKDTKKPSMILQY